MKYARSRMIYALSGTKHGLTGMKYCQIDLKYETSGVPGDNLMRSRTKIDLCIR